MSASSKRYAYSTIGLFQKGFNPYSFRTVQYSTVDAAVQYILYCTTVYEHVHSMIVALVILYCTRINSDIALLGGGVHVGYSDGTVRSGGPVAAPCFVFTRRST